MGTVDVSLGHWTGSWSVQMAVMEHHDVYDKRAPATLRRPDRGSRVDRIACRDCDAVVSVRVFSRLRTLSKRCLWATELIVGLTVVVGLLRALLTGRFDAVSAPVNWSAFTALLLAFFLVGAGLCLLLMEYGVRLESGSPGTVSHALLSRRGAELGTMSEHGRIRGVLGVTRRRRPGPDIAA